MAELVDVERRKAVISVLKDWLDGGDHLILKWGPFADEILAALRSANTVRPEVVDRGELARAIHDAQQRAMEEVTQRNFALSQRELDLIAVDTILALLLTSNDTPAAADRDMVMVPREATEAMLSAVCPEPTHLYGRDGRGEEYEAAMKVATTVDRMTAASQYRQMIEAALLPTSGAASDVWPACPSCGVRSREAHAAECKWFGDQLRRVPSTPDAAKESVHQRQAREVMNPGSGGLASQGGGQSYNATPDAVAGVLAGTMMTETDRAAIATAYGLLWHMDIDRRDRNLLLASDARRTLLDVLYDSERKEGIVAAAARLRGEGK